MLLPVEDHGPGHDCSTEQQAQCYTALGTIFSHLPFWLSKDQALSATLFFSPGAVIPNLFL